MLQPQRRLLLSRRPRGAVVSRFFSGCDDCAGCDAGPLAKILKHNHKPKPVPNIVIESMLGEDSSEDGTVTTNSASSSSSSSSNSSNTTPLFSMFGGKMRPIHRKRLNQLSTVFMTKQLSLTSGLSLDIPKLKEPSESKESSSQSELNLSQCQVEELHIHCEDCGVARRVETPKDFLDPAKNASGQALLAICPSCVVLVK